MDTPIYEKMIARWPGDGPELIKELYPIDEPLQPVSEVMP